MSHFISNDEWFFLMSGEIGIRNDRMQSDIFLIDYPNWETNKNLSDSYKKNMKLLIILQVDQTKQDPRKLKYLG